MESLEGVPALCRADRLVLLRGRGRTNVIKDIPVVLHEEGKEKKRKRKRLLKKWRFLSDTEDDDFIVGEQTVKKKFSKRNNNTGDKSSSEESSSAKRRNLQRRASFASQVLPDKIKKLKGTKPCLKGVKGKNSKVKNKFLFPRSDSCDDDSPSEIQQVKGKRKTVSSSLPRKRLSIEEDSESDPCGPSFASKIQKSMFRKSEGALEDGGRNQRKKFKFLKSNDSCRDVGASCSESTKISPKSSSRRERIAERSIEDSIAMPDNPVQLGWNQNIFDKKLEDDATHYAGKVNDDKNTTSNDKVHQKSSEIPSLDIDTKNTITSLQEFVKIEKDGMSLPDGYGSDKLAQVLIFLLEEKVRVSTSHSERDLFRKTIHTLLCGGCKDKEKHNKVRCKRCEGRDRKKVVNKDPGKEDDEIKNDKKDKGEKKPKVSITSKVTEAHQKRTLPSSIDKLPISSTLSCELCGDLFEQQEDLNAHAETPHIRECLRDGCGKKFVNLSGLIKHTFNKHKTYESKVKDGALQETAAEEVLHEGKNSNTLNSKDDKELDREKVFGGDNEYDVGVSVLTTSQLQPLFEDELDTEDAKNTKDFNILNSKDDKEIDREKVFNGDDEYNVGVKVLNTSQFQPLFEDEIDTLVAINTEMEMVK